MTMSIYTMLGERNPRFDGHIAWKHLLQVLGYQVVEIERAPDRMRAQFGSWQREVGGVLSVRSPVFLLVSPRR